MSTQDMYPDSFLEGTETERRFKRVLEGYDKKVKLSSYEEDLREHWDFKVGSKKIDVKARKRLRRHDTGYDDIRLYVEFRGITGHPGWIYGEADYIAFERPKGFVMVERQELAILAEKLIKKEWSPFPTLYKAYRRKSRPKECVGMIKYADLMQIKYYFLKYDRPS